MQKINLEQAQAGMVLARAITNEKGITLCGEGTALTDSLIERLKKMAIQKVAVEGHPVDDGSEELSPETMREVIIERFRLVRKNYLNNAIMKALLENLETEG
jgi:hypothetical protein